MAQLCVCARYVLAPNSVPISLSGLSSLLDKVSSYSHDLTLAYDPSENDPSLHVSLTRPIILRKHEESTFTEQVLQTVNSLSLSRYESMTHAVFCWLSLGLYAFPVIHLSVYFYVWN